MVKSFRSWGVLGLIVAALPLGKAQAQLGDSPEVQRGITVVNRQRPDYDPLGVRLGGFRLNGAVDAVLGWDINIIRSRINVVYDVLTYDRVMLY